MSIPAPCKGTPAEGLEHCSPWKVPCGGVRQQPLLSPRKNPFCGRALCAFCRTGLVFFFGTQRCAGAAAGWGFRLTRLYMATPKGSSCTTNESSTMVCRPNAVSSTPLAAIAMTPVRLP